MKYILAFLGMLLVARPITLSLSVINRQSVQKKLGFVFTPIPMKDKYKKFFWGKWNRNFFECDGGFEISLLVLILIPLNLLMYVLFLSYFVTIIVSMLVSNHVLTLFAYEKIGFYAVIYAVFLGGVTTIFSYWSYIWKRPKVTLKEQKKSINDLNEGLKKAKNQSWYYPLWENLMNISYLSNDEKGEYYFLDSQMPTVTKLVKQSSKNAKIILNFQGDLLSAFVVKDITNGNDVFKGLIKKANQREN